MGGALVKRSMKIGEKRTSVALEPEFWTALEALARARGKTLPKLFAMIVSANTHRPAASALRVFGLGNIHWIVSVR